MATNTIPPHPEKESRRVVRSVLAYYECSVVRFVSRPLPHSLSLCLALDTIGWLLAGHFSSLRVCDSAAAAVDDDPPWLYGIFFTCSYTHAHFHRQTNDVSAATHPRISSDPIDPNGCHTMHEQEKTGKHKDPDLVSQPENGNPNPNPEQSLLA